MAIFYIVYDQIKRVDEEIVVQKLPISFLGDMSLDLPQLPIFSKEQEHFHTIWLSLIEELFSYHKDNENQAEVVSLLSQVLTWLKETKLHSLRTFALEDTAMIRRVVSFSDTTWKRDVEIQIIFQSDQESKEQCISIDIDATIIQVSIGQTFISEAVSPLPTITLLSQMFQYVFHEPFLSEKYDALCKLEPFGECIPILMLFILKAPMFNINASYKLHNKTILH